MRKISFCTSRSIQNPNLSPPCVNQPTRGKRKHHREPQPMLLGGGEVHRLDWRLNTGR